MRYRASGSMVLMVMVVPLWSSFPAHRGVLSRGGGPFPAPPGGSVSRGGRRGGWRRTPRPRPPWPRRPRRRSGASWRRPRTRRERPRRRTRGPRGGRTGWRGGRGCGSRRTWGFLSGGVLAVQVPVAGLAQGLAEFPARGGGEFPAVALDQVHGVGRGRVLVGGRHGPGGGGAAEGACEGEGGEGVDHGGSQSVVRVMGVGGTRPRPGRYGGSGGDIGPLEDAPARGGVHEVLGGVGVPARDRVRRGAVALDRVRDVPRGVHGPEHVGEALGAIVAADARL